MPPADAVQIAQAHRLSHPEVTPPCTEFRLWWYLQRRFYDDSFRAALEQEWDTVSCGMQQCATLGVVIEQFVRALNASSARTYIHLQLSCHGMDCCAMENTKPFTPAIACKQTHSTQHGRSAGLSVPETILLVQFPSRGISPHCTWKSMRPMIQFST